MKTFPGEFLNVDLDLKSRVDPAVLIEAWKRQTLAQKIPGLRGKHWVRFMLTFQPRTPGEAIRRFAKLIKNLPSPARRIWSQAKKEIDIGIQAGFERGSTELVLDANVVRTLEQMGVPVRITVYSPLLRLDAEARQKRRSSE
jgi:hypothetical protein